MRATISGTVVETESAPWDFNGRTGIAHAIYLRSGSARDGAQRVKVTAEQVDQFAEGDSVDLPVDIYPQASDFGGPAKLRVVLDPEYVKETSGSSFGSSLRAAADF